MEGQDTVALWRSDKYDPLEWMARLWPSADIGHIKFDPSERGDYYRTGQGGGDGTFLFFYQDMGKVLAPFVEMSTFWKPSLPSEDLSNVRRIEYTLGWVRVATVYGSIFCRGGFSISGEKYRIRVRAKARIIYRGGDT